jgi:ABC-type glycerol-3-phosphate transport system substrate-binding protein
MLRKLLLIAVSLVAVVPAASSQTVKVSDSSEILDVSATGDADGTANVTFGIQACLDLFAEDPDISVSWTFTSRPATGNDYQIKLQRGSESCSFTEIDAATDI